MKKKDENRRYTAQSVITVLSLILTAIILAVGCAIWEDYQDKIMDNQKNQMLLTSRTLAENMELSLESYRSSLDFLDDIAQIKESDVVYEKYLKMKQDYETNLFWEDAAGEVIYGLAEMEWKEKLPVTKLNTEESVWMYQNTIDDWYLVFKKKQSSGDFLCLSVDEEKYYQRLISNIQIGTNGYIMVKNSEGLILMHPEKEQWGIMVIEGRRKMYPDLDYSSLEKMVREQCSGGEGISEYYSYWWGSENLEKVRKISAYAPIELGDDFWIISAVVDYDDLSAPVEAGFRRVSILFSVSLVLFVLLFICVGKLLLDKQKAAEEIVSLRNLNERLEQVHQGEEMIAHQQRLQVMGTMTGGIAHEFNNFLTPIMGYAELLMMELPEDCDAYESALEIYEASEKAKDVIRQISSMSRRNVETVYRQIPAGKLMSRAIKMMESICPAHIHLKTDFHLEDQCILGNTTQINQVLLNICVNAIHAIGKKEGMIQVRADCIDRAELEHNEHLESAGIPEHWNQYLKIEIEDNGCGMEPDVLRQIFTPFFTTKKTGEGTGLGLALAEQFVTSHRGYIYAESQRGMGTTFFIFLPVMDHAADLECLGQKEKDSLQIVAVDDNAKILEMLKKNFGKLGIEIRVCRTKKELNTLLEERIPDVLVIDESLEDGSGVDYCMASQGKYPGMIKIIMADFATMDIVEAKQKGIIDGYLTKPVSDTTILEIIRTNLAEH